MSANPTLISAFDSIEEPPVDQRTLPLTNGKIATLLFLSTEVMFFTAILGSYLVLRFGSKYWPTTEKLPLDFLLDAVNTAVLLISSLTIVLSARAAKKDKSRRSKLWILVTLLLALTFAGIKSWQFNEKIELGFYPNATANILFDEPDERYLSAVVLAARNQSEVIADKKSGRDDAQVIEWNKIRDGVVHWAEYKVGRTSNIDEKLQAIQALAFQIFPAQQDDVIEKYLADEVSTVNQEKTKLKKQEERINQKFKIEQSRLKSIMADRESADPQKRELFSRQSESIEILINQQNDLRKKLLPIEQRLSIGQELNLSNGINRQYALKLPIVFPGAKSWVDAYYLLSGFHALHLIAGIVLLGIWLFFQFNSERAMWLENFGLYWHFVDVVWWCIFAVVYFT